MTHTTKASWSDEMRDRFDVLFNDNANFSYPQIMRKMNEMFPAHPLSRSAICGHAFRNGYTKGRSARSVIKRENAIVAKPSKRNATPNVHQHTAKRIAAAAKRAETEAQKAELGLDDTETKEGQTLLNQPCWEGTIANSIPLEDLNDSSCRWPIKAEGSTMLRFCHNKKGRGSYCFAHGSLAYTAARERSQNHKPHYRPSGANTSGLWGR